MNATEYITKNFTIVENKQDHTSELVNTSRDTLAQMLADLGLNMGAEVGVERGIYSKVLLDANPKLHLYSIDAWTAYEGYRDHMTQEEMDVLYREAKEKLHLYQDRNVVIKGFSVDVARDFEDEALDFVYLDGNHEFVEVVNDIAAWERKVKVGGIVAGHDYIKRKGAEYLMQVPYAIHGYINAYGIRPLYILGRKEKIQGELRESTRSWFYVKPQRAAMKPGWKQT